MADWDMRTNFKNKPESQGTLFQGGKDQLNPQRRYPRGYTPQRQREISEALPKSDTVADPTHHPRVVDAVARSTMPVGDLRGLKEVHNRPKEGTKGTYWPARNTAGVDMSQPGADETLIHELGHHNDNRLSTLRRKDVPTTFGKVPEVADQHAVLLNERRGKDAPPNDTERFMARTDVERGVAEALADTYYVDNYRSRGRNPKQATEGHYQRNFEPKKLESRYPGYTYIRPHRNLGAQWHQETLFP